MKHNHIILITILLIFAFSISPLAAQDETNRLLDLLANPPEDGLLIIETEAPSFMYVLSWLVVDVSTGEYYDLDDIIPWCTRGMPSSYKGKLLVRASCEGIEKYYVIEDGKVKELLLPEDSGVYIDGEVQWTPDGKLSFVGQSTRDEGWDTDIFLWDGMTVQAITQNDVDDYGLNWSSDGRLAFTSGNKDTNTDVFVWDGKSVQKIWQHEQNDYAGAWSPDGRLSIHSKDDIYVWDGTQILNVYSDPYLDYFSHWSSDGKLAFTTSYHLIGEIYVWDGQQVSNLSQSPVDDRYPMWGPDNQLAFISFGGGNKNWLYVWENGILTKPTAKNVFRPFSWSGDGRLAFAVHSEKDRYGFEIHVWDGQDTSLVTSISASGLYQQSMWVDVP